MKRICFILIWLLLVSSVAVPALFASDDFAERLNNILIQATDNRFWQVMPDEVLSMINEKRTDFLIVDVRPNPFEYKQGHIPGAIQVPVQNILKPENLQKLPKNKMLILVCVTGQTQNLPVIALRALGYNAYTMSFGMSSWITDYYGGKIMQGAIHGAETKNYPLER